MLYYILSIVKKERKVKVGALKIIEKMVAGRIEKYYKEVCLMEQPFVKDPDKTISDLITESIAKIGENISIRRFTRYQLGEGIEKKEENFAEEVMSFVK